MCGLSVEEVSTNGFSKLDYRHPGLAPTLSTCWSVLFLQKCLQRKNHVASQGACFQIHKPDSDIIQAVLAKVE